MEYIIAFLFFFCVQIIDWFVQICLALQYLHKNNVLHRDIKPQVDIDKGHLIM